MNRLHAIRQKAVEWIRTHRSLRLLCRITKVLICALLVLLVSLHILVLSLNAAVIEKTERRILSKEALVASDENFDFILVLGCRVYSDGTPSAMLYDRVASGADLYQAGICQSLLLSGDSRSPDEYDETGAMRSLAISLGVDAECIRTDGYGLSTYESIYRAKHLFEGKRILIVTQSYHLYRALYLAEKLGLEAYGVGADLRPYSTAFSNELREVLARTKDVVQGLIQPIPDSIKQGS
ncbi:MAG: YdcF family protein [Clostridia bacterium]|nr:YdcF family protein [Clostridia bacterium]